MASEQQFCLRWNNHQSTLVAVFDTLLESGTLVDCTLAAEGQYLKAHKVVLSACSPYFELLLSQHYEKHPIIILKDVKFQELKAMMDYMYRGEVNISQDQLGALLKAAESLQIKGLSEGGGGTDREPEPKRHDRRKEIVQPSAPRTPPILPHSSGLTIEHRRNIPPQVEPQVVDLPEDSPPPISHSKLSASRDGSISPVPRKRKKHRRRSSGDEASLGVPGVLPMTDNHETSSSCELPTQTQQTSNIPATITPVVPNPIISKMDPMSHSVEDKNNEADMTRPLVPTQVVVPSPQALPLGEPESVVHKVEPQSEMMLEPKSEYLDEDINEDSVEDLTLDDDMDDMDQSRPGPSHGGESSSAQGTGYLNQLYSLMQHQVPPTSQSLYDLPLHGASRPLHLLTGDKVDALLHSLAADVMFRKYSVHHVIKALEAVLKDGSTVSQASVMFGFAPWHVASDRSTDEVFMAAQEAVGAHRDSQGNSTRSFATSFSESNQINLCPRQSADNMRGVCPTTLNLNTRVEPSSSSRNVNGVISYSDKTVQGERSHNVFDWINQSENDAAPSEYSSYVHDKLFNYPLETNFHKPNDSVTGNTNFVDFDKNYELNSVYGGTLACPYKNSEGNYTSNSKKHCAKKSQKLNAGVSPNKYKYSCMFCKSNFRTLSENILHQSTCRSKSESASYNSMLSKTGSSEESFDQNVFNDLTPELPTKHLLVVLNTKVPCLQCNRFFNNNRLLMNHLLTCKSKQNSTQHTISNIDRKTL